MVVDRGQLGATFTLPQGNFLLTVRLGVHQSWFELREEDRNLLLLSGIDHRIVQPVAYFT
jgi:hypothetical protein